MSPGFIVPFTCFHSSTVDWTSISPTRLATNTGCLLRSLQPLLQSHRVGTMCHCLDLDIVTFGDPFSQSQTVKWRLQMQFGYRLLLHCGSSSLPSEEWQFHSIMVFHSQVSHYTHCFQRSIRAKMQFKLFVTFGKISSLEKHVLQLCHFSNPIQELLLFWVISFVMPCCPLLAQIVFSRMGKSHRELCKEPLRVKNWRYERKHCSLYDFTGYFNVSTTTNSHIVIAQIQLHAQKWRIVSLWWNCYFCTLGVRFSHYV